LRVTQVIFTLRKGETKEAVQPALELDDIRFGN